MIIDFFNESNLIKSFAELYNLNNTQICNIIMQTKNNKEENLIAVFCEESGIKLDEIVVTKDLIFNGKIVSTSIDQLTSLKKTGLLPVDLLLEEDSPIRRHLEKYNLQINPSRQEMVYKGERYFIPKGFEKPKDCKSCALRNGKCQYDSNRKESDGQCSYIIAINPLAIKLYNDKAEIEMFLSASLDKMLNYSSVSNYPEIFDTITTFIRKYFNEYLPISSDWMEAKQATFIITVPVLYEDMSYHTDFTDPRDYNNAYDLYLKYQEYCSKTYCSVYEIPICFWDNIWIINECLERISKYPNKATNKTLYAGIKHDISIPYSNLKIDFVKR